MHGMGGDGLGVLEEGRGEGKFYIDKVCIYICGLPVDVHKYFKRRCNPAATLLKQNSCKVPILLLYPYAFSGLKQ